MELRQLRYFIAAADAKSFVKAAASLYVSRQAVSRSVSQLEEELGTVLFIRDQNGANLTPAGLLFYDRISSVISELDNIEKEMTGYDRSYYQHLRLLFAVNTLRIYEGALSAYEKSAPNLRLEYTECPEELCAGKLSAHEADLAVCPVPFAQDQFFSEKILSSPYGLLLQKKDSLSELPFIEESDLGWLPIACFQESRTETVCRQLGIRPSLRSLDTFSLFEKTAEGHFAMLLPKILVPEKRDDLTFVPLSGFYEWPLYRISLQKTEKNSLFATVADALSLAVFDRVRKDLL